MELNFFSFSVFSGVALFAFFVSRLVRSSKSSDLKLPPGPWKLPLIGNLHQLASPLPHQALRDLARKYGPLMHLQLGEVSAVVVSSPDMAKEVMRTHDAIFASRSQIIASRILSYDSRNIGFAPYGGYWRQLRKIFAMELLSTKRVSNFKHIREEEMFGLAKMISFSDGQPINLTKRIFSTIYGINSIAVTGEKSNDMEQMISYVQEGLKIGSGFNVADYFPSFPYLHVMSGVKTRLETLRKDADKIFNRILSEHKLNFKETSGGAADEDFIHVLLRFKDDPEFPLSDSDIKAVIFDLFGAGSESTATTVDWTMAELIKNPSIMEKAQAEIRKVFDKTGQVNETEVPKLDYLNLVIKEVLRLHIPGPLLLPRECGERCVINGYIIPAKTKIIVNAWAMARDPNYWVDPDEFIPERFLGSSIQFKGNDFEYIPFGSGRRICPGISLGLANVQLLLAHLLFHFDWKLADGEKPQDMDMTDLFGVSVSRKQQLCLVPTIYPKSSLML